MKAETESNYDAIVRLEGENNELRARVRSLEAQLDDTEAELRDAVAWISEH